MKKYILVPALLFAAVSFNSCKKNNHDRNGAADPELVAGSADQAFVSNEIDAFTLDMNSPLEASFSGRGWDNEICGATLSYDTTSSTHSVTITYDGQDCAGYTTRTGSIVLSIPASTHWGDAGAQATITYHQVHVTRIMDNKSIIINGIHTLTNTSGGHLYQLLSGVPSITHRITSDSMSVTFDDGSMGYWQVGRQRVYTLADGDSVTITGTEQSASQSGIAEWGYDRYGIAFVSAISQPLVISAGCQFRLVSGQVTYDRAGSSATLTFGLNAAGNPVSCPAGNYFYKLSWTAASGSTFSYIGAY